MRFLVLGGAFCCMALGWEPSAQTDGGMWTFNNFLQKRSHGNTDLILRSVARSRATRLVANCRLDGGVQPIGGGRLAPSQRDEVHGIMERAVKRGWKGANVRPWCIWG